MWWNTNFIVGPVKFEVSMLIHCSIRARSRRSRGISGPLTFSLM